MLEDLKPRLFVGSSSESRHVVEAIRGLLSEHVEVLAWYYEGFFALNQQALASILARIHWCDFGLLIFSADDEVKSRGVSLLKTRDNVVLEFGLCLGVMGPKRAFFLRQDGVQLPSNLNGLTTVGFDKCVSKNMRLLQRQQALEPAAVRILDEVRSLGRRSTTGSYICSWGPAVREKGIAVQVSRAVLEEYCGRTLLLAARAVDESENVKDYRTSTPIGVSAVYRIREPHPKDGQVLTSPIPGFDSIWFGWRLEAYLLCFDDAPTLEGDPRCIQDLLNIGGRVIDGKSVGHFPDFRRPNELARLLDMFYSLEQCHELSRCLDRAIRDKHAQLQGRKKAGVIAASGRRSRSTKSVRASRRTRNAKRKKAKK